MASPSELSIPLLIWVDDEIARKVELTDYVQELDIQLQSLTSTDDAKKWFDQNLDFLRANDSEDKIRVITDQAPVEVRLEGKGIWNNPHAGEDLAVYIRSLGLNIPILVYTGDVGIIITRYIRKINNAGSTRSRSIVLEYIKGLVGGKKCTQWREFDAGGSRKDGV